MRPIFDYLDYRDLLKDAFEDRKAELPLFTYRMMALELGLDTSYVFRIIHKELHLPGRCHQRALDFLGLSGRSAEYFLLLVTYARERSAKAKRETLEKAMTLRDVSLQALSESQTALFRDWWIAATRSLLEVMDGRAVPKEIASRLSPSISEAEASEAVKVLLELGLVKKVSSGRLALANAHLTAGGTRMTSAIKHFQKQILALASESLDRYDKDSRDVTTLTVAVDQDTFRMVREMSREFRREVQKCVEKSRSPDRVMSLAIAFFPLAPKVER